MVNISVCIGSACHIKGSYNVLNTFQQMIEEYNLADKIELKATFCLGKCSDQVSVKIDEEDVCSVSGAAARKFFKDEVMHRLED